MTRIKKLLALTLAMVMAFTLLAMPAMAYGEDHEHECAVCSDEGSIMPRKPAKLCFKCQVAMTYNEVKLGNTYYYYFVCPVCGDDTAPLPLK